MNFSFRVNQNYSDSFRYLYPNQSEKRFVSRSMKNGQKPIRLNPINSETSTQNQVFNPDQPESIRVQIDPTRIFNQNQSDLGLISTVFH